MARTKTNTRDDTKILQHHDATDIQKSYIFVFFVFLEHATLNIVLIKKLIKC